MSRHDELRATWAPGQIWETRIEECAADPNAWVPVAGGGRMEPLWEERQEYRQRPAAELPPGTAVYEKPVNCREAGPGRGLCIQCANGHYERCLYLHAAARVFDLSPQPRPEDVPSIYDVVPPPARIWLERQQPVPWAASRDWHEGWDHCRARCRALLDAHLQRGRTTAGVAEVRHQTEAPADADDAGEGIGHV